MGNTSGDRSAASGILCRTTRRVMSMPPRYQSHLRISPRVSFSGSTFWIGFSINWLAIEIWLHTSMNVPPSIFQLNSQAASSAETDESKPFRNRRSTIL